MSDDPFLGTIYTEDYDEQVRPQRHAPHLRPFTGSYEVLVEASELVFAPSKKAARAAMLDRLPQADLNPSGDDHDAVIRAVGIAPGAPERRSHSPLHEGVPAYTWFAMHKNPDFHASLQTASPLLPLDLDALLAQTDGTKRRPRLRSYRARYALIFECARALWARDAEHAELLLEQDIGVLLTVDCLDRWTDDQTSYGWRLEDISAAEAPA
jgi:hypothetical protein